MKAVIFDMDGLLLDTERIALNTFMEACKACDYEPKKEVYLKCIGSNGEKTKQVLIEGHGPDFPFDAISNIWSRKYYQATLERQIPLKKGAREILNLLKKSQIRMGVATSTKYATAIKKLNNAKLSHFFEVIVGGDQVEIGKPNPEVYHKISVLLEASPNSCLAIEDSDNGVKAAYYAGMNVIQVPDLNPPSPEVKAFHHFIVDSLEDVSQIIITQMNSIN